MAQFVHEKNTRFVGGVATCGFVGGSAGAASAMSSVSRGDKPRVWELFAELVVARGLLKAC